MNNESAVTTVVPAVAPAATSTTSVTSVTSSPAMNFRKFGVSDSCKTHRIFGDADLNEAEKPAFVRTRICKDAIKEFKYITGSLKSVSDVDAYIRDKMSQRFPDTKAREHQINEATCLAKKYLDADSRTCGVPLKKTVSFNGIDIEVKPHFMYKYEAEKWNDITNNREKMPVVEVVMLSASTTKMNNGIRKSEYSLYHNPEALSLLLYGKSELGGKKGVVRVVYDTLKTAADHNSDYSRSWAVAQRERSKKTDNSVWIEVFFPEDTETEIPRPLENVMKNFSSSMLTFLEGREKCPKNACDKCDLRTLCNYHPAPLKKKEEAKIEKKQNSFSLTPEQEEIIHYKKGIARVNAGAGVGKTFVVVLRIIQLLLDGVLPEKILMTTFTNAGVGEMQKRLRDYMEAYGLPYDVEEIMICTFNSLGHDLIKRHYKDLGFTEEPGLIDDILQYDLLNAILNSRPEIEGMDYKNPTMNLNSACRGVLPELMQEITRIKEKDLQDFSSYVASGGAYAYDQKKDIWEVYEEFSLAMKKNNLVDFTDQRNLVLRLLEMNPYVITDTYEFDHVIVDEFQDSDDFQISFIKQLIDHTSFALNGSLMVVGDDSQSIYGFRGTSPRGIIEFPEIMGCEIDDFYLMQSHRSTPEIVNAANELIELNRHRVVKTMTSARPSGNVPVIKGFESTKDEIAFVGLCIEKLIGAGVKPEDIAFLSFKRTTLYKMSQELTSRGILALLDVSEKMLDNSRVQAAIALCQFIENPKATVPLATYLNAIFEGQLLSWGAGKVSKLVTSNKEDFCNLFFKLNDKQKKNYIIDLLSVLDDGRDEVYTSFLEEKVKNNKMSWDALVSYVLKMEYYSSDSSATRDLKDYAAVSLSTAHSSKGKEWKYVFVSITDFLIPGMYLYGPECEERRRLIFVAMTRAKDALYITSLREVDSDSGMTQTPHWFYRELRNLPGIDASKDGITAKGASA